MGIITGTVTATNSASGTAYTNDQLVLYADVSACPSNTAISATVSVTFDYTANGSGSSAYWTTATLPTVTLSTKLPFAVYVCVKCILSTLDDAYSSAAAKAIYFTKTLSANTTYSNSSLTYQGNTTFGGVAGKPYSGFKIVPSNVSVGISPTSISNYTQANTAVSADAINKYINYNVTCNAGTTQIAYGTLLVKTSGYDYSIWFNPIMYRSSSSYLPNNYPSMSTMETYWNNYGNDNVRYAYAGSQTLQIGWNTLPSAGYYFLVSDDTTCKIFMFQLTSANITSLQNGATVTLTASQIGEIM